MARIVRNWQPIEADASKVAPHRYLYTGMNDDYRDAKTYREFIDGCPYKIGDIVYIEEGNKAVLCLITGVWREYVERWGEYREKYRVQRATAKGLFSKTWFYTYSGFIQRGYWRAGLAPDYKA